MVAVAVRIMDREHTIQVIESNLTIQVKGSKLVGAWPAIWLLGTQPPNWPHCGSVTIAEFRNGIPEVVSLRL